MSSVNNTSVINVLVVGSLPILTPSLPIDHHINTDTLHYSATDNPNETKPRFIASQNDVNQMICTLVERELVSHINTVEAKKIQHVPFRTKKLPNNVSVSKPIDAMNKSLLLQNNGIEYVNTHDVTELILSFGWDDLIEELKSENLSKTPPVNNPRSQRMTWLRSIFYDRYASVIEKYKRILDQHKKHQSIEYMIYLCSFPSTSTNEDEVFLVKILNSVIYELCTLNGCIYLDIGSVKEHPNEITEQSIYPFARLIAESILTSRAERHKNSEYIHNDIRTLRPKPVRSKTKVMGTGSGFFSYLGKGVSMLLEEFDSVFNINDDDSDSGGEEEYDEEGFLDEGNDENEEELSEYTSSPDMDSLLDRNT